MAYIALFFRWSLAVIFAMAGTTKLQSSLLFRGAIDHYGLPSAFVPVVAAVLPWIELLIALALAIGFIPRAAAIGALLLLSAFTLGVTRSLVRGGHFDCGCGLAQNQMISWAVVARNLLLIAAAAVVTVFPTGGLAVWIGWGHSAHRLPAWQLAPIPLVVLLLAAVARSLQLGVLIVPRKPRGLNPRGGKE